LLAVDHSAGVEQSRTALLELIGAHRELTLVRGLGGIGDELIRAGTHRLLEAQVFREVGIDDLPACGGDTVLLPGSGAWCRPYHEWMPRTLAIAELRFDRVIVLPSSFDVSEDSVRHALSHTGATVFAREQESLRRIEGLCRAHFAHDCAFFFDYSGHRAPGIGTLNAFRTDREAAGGELELDDNDDISASAASLEAWLAEIERHALIRTDRAHVMIAAALMGKEVEVAPSSYHKLDALTVSLLRGFPVRRIDPPRRRPANVTAITAQAAATREQLRTAAGASPVADCASAGPARVTAVILTRDRPDLVRRAVRSVTASSVPVRVLVIDNNSAPEARDTLAALAATDSRIELRLANRNLACAGGRRLGVELVDTEYVLFLDDDAELIDGALEHLLFDLEAHPEAAGVSGRVVGPDGALQHYGGWMEVSDEAARFGLYGSGLRFDDPLLPSSGQSGWTPGTAGLLRTQILRDVPLDDAMVTYYEDNDWCYRVEQCRPGSFRRCHEALVLHHHDFTAAPPAPSSRLVERYELVEKLASQAHFYRASGVLLDIDLDSTLPELRLADGRTGVAATRLLMELLAARGVDWTVMEWMNGGLDPLLESARTGQLEGHPTELETPAAGLETQLESVRAHSAGIETHAAGLETQLEALRAHDSGLQTQVESLQAQAAGLETHTAGLEAQLESRREHTAQLETRLETLQAHATELETHAAEIETQLEDVRRGATELETHAAGLTAQLEALHTYTAELQTHTAGLETHRAELEAQAEALGLHTAGLEAQVDSLRAEQAETDAQLAWLHERHLTLCKVEAGGWWRLRSRLLPLLRVAAKLRRVAGKRT
jgi:GT2 family glycosyltransferase/peptidoglycan hydrolase CwlO-like protein